MNFIKILILTSLLLQLGSMQNYSSAEQVFDAAEDYLINTLYPRVNTLYENRCSSNTNCKTYNQCTSYAEFAPELTCQTDFYQSKMSQCQAEGVYINNEHSAGRCANSISCTDQEDEEIICAMSTLFDDDNTKIDDNSFFKFSYVGFHNSYRIIYPYNSMYDLQSQSCDDYDPRFRPWYVAASTGAKNVVIIIDTSNSMGGSKYSQRMEPAQNALKAVIDTLGQSDYFQIVTFSDSETGTSVLSVDNNKLVQATKQNRDAGMNMANNLSTGGGTNYQIAFEKAFDLFETSIDSEISTMGENIILFLTDGAIAQGAGSDDPQDLYDIIDGYQSNSNMKDVSIFTYTIGNDNAGGIPHEISCQNTGISYEINDSQTQSELASDMKSYYTYLSKGVQITSPVWSQVYSDFTTGLDFITSSYPIYVENENGIELLLGVVAVDLAVEDLEQFSDYVQQRNERQRSARYSLSQSDNNLNECDLEDLRANKCNNVVNCQSQGYTSYDTCPGSFNVQPWKSSGTQLTTSGICCPYTPPNNNNNNIKEESTSESTTNVGVIIGAVVGTLAFLTIIAVALYCKGQKAKEQKRMDDLRREDEEQKRLDQQRQRQQSQQRATIIQQQQQPVQHDIIQPNMQPNYGMNPQHQPPLAPHMGMQHNSGIQQPQPYNPLNNQMQGPGDVQVQQGYNYPLE